MERALEAQGLAWIGQHWQTFDPCVADHLRAQEAALNALFERGPEFVNSQTGRDWFSFEDNLRIIDAAEALAARRNARLLHETHRGKALCSPWTARRILEARPQLALAVDLSHWCCVCESLLADQGQAVEAALERARHVHARVGHPQGAQVDDFRAPESAEATAAHLAWWDRVVARAAERGDPAVGFTTEFGPPPYARRSAEKVWELNLAMRELLFQRYSRMR